ncbi:MAG: protein kinase [Anaerolineae bacterium]|nr:protein kinase [Anaerolineae bacterium]
MSDETMIAKRYDVKEKFGDYALFTLYRAWDTESKQDVMVTLGHTVSPQHHLPRYQTSERKFMSLTHPNLVTLRDFGIHDNRRYQVLPALIGQPLQNYLSGQPQTLANIRKWAQSLGQVLAYLHNENIIYQHLSPATIWIDDQYNLYLLPVQVTIPSEPSAVISLPDMRYQSPEQISAQNITNLSDQYSLAVILYQMATGKLPHPFNNATQHAMTVVTGTPDAAQKWRNDIPQAMNDALSKALSKQVQNRFPSVTDFIEEFLHDDILVGGNIETIDDVTQEEVIQDKKRDKSSEDGGETLPEESPRSEEEKLEEVDDGFYGDLDDKELEKGEEELGIDLGGDELGIKLGDLEGEESAKIDEPAPPPPPAEVPPAKPTPEPVVVEDLHNRRSELLAQLLVQRLLQRQSPATAVGVDDEIDKLKAEIASLNQQIPEQLPTLNQAEAQFTAYYARESGADTAYGLYVYAHVPDALQQIARDIEAFSQKMGGAVPRPKQAEQSKRLKVGIHLTVAVEAEGLEFEPLALTKKWNVPFTRFDFTYTAPQSLISEIVNGRISIMVSGIEIAHIPFATLVDEAAESLLQMDTMPENPLAAARLTASDTAQLYDKIFVSYSRKDDDVVKNYRLAQLAVGHEVFMDSNCSGVL